jgi:hypothetical protein
MFNLAKKTLRLAFSYPHLFYSPSSSSPPWTPPTTSTPSKFFQLLPSNYFLQGMEVNV